MLGVVTVVLIIDRGKDPKSPDLYKKSQEYIIEGLRYG